MKTFDLISFFVYFLSKTTKMKKIFYLLCFVLISCTDKNKIEPGDIVKKCVIDSSSVSPPRSTINPDPVFTYYTNCGEILTTNRSGTYHIGDTITYVYKKK